ncbi:(Fe-S)-binding protein [Apibacter sp. B3889]|uniref:(Fe-S)-binding protein n=1 Tax=unclassified Apibacter TaxID=2630820 RepID=UPI00132B4A65|nr:MULTISPECIES: (Fe-S)-binding protein [unclassified Apibacter]MXO34810.1 (Fe-S)-binding protein [Apibacter sp. B3883]MXO42086.1 (Fe-S)-binding protein [Apibacter sp. B3889]MXP03656.1 (Fe-S)-binding protein [Apibacter sp. B3887]MXP08108.1 (Fe-S)-binding protein [Apibacter sp. B3935]
MDRPIKTMAEFKAEGKSPEILFWVGCAGSFDDRAKKITKSFASLLQKANIEFAILGQEEGCTGDPAKRAGNEFLFQMQALMNIEVLNSYEIKKIVTACPHCFNTLKNEYPQLGGTYEILHHTQFLLSLLNEGRIKVKGGIYKGKKITFHDPCYLGRANDVYEAPRELLAHLEVNLLEMKRCKQNGLCCGAGGAQMFKEPEPGIKDINVERTEEALQLNPDIIATGCPFCNTMLTDGLQSKNKNSQIYVKDLAELLNENLS